MQIAFLMAVSIFLVRGIRNEHADRSTTMKTLSILDWYRILRLQYQLTMFQSVRYALWLAR
jgi:hypothetical protein